nr:unnamed protein product [Spirometra erinaceieuropaei]
MDFPPQTSPDPIPQQLHNFIFRLHRRPIVTTAQNVMAIIATPSTATTALSSEVQPPSAPPPSVIPTFTIFGIIPVASTVTTHLHLPLNKTLLAASQSPPSSLAVNIRFQPVCRKMSKSAGTLITTNEATYLDPRLMPGYAGFCPEINFGYGQTYGAATAQHFQDTRNQALRNSRAPLATGGCYPSFYSHNPEVFLSNLNRGRDRYLDRVHIELLNTDFERMEQLRRFDQLAQRHRLYYRDRTDTVHPVPTFQIPESSARRIQAKYGF